MTIEKRDARVAIKISGPDATHLLQDVLTPTIAEDETARWYGLLAPQGKILAEGLIGWAEGAYWLDVDAAAAENFFKRMKMYRLRAKAEIDDLRDSHRVGFARDEAPTGIRHSDRMGPIDMGWRVIAPVEATAEWVQDDAVYQAVRIGAGIAHQGNDFPANDAFAHDVGLDIIDGIDFKKGCYVGQEVVSRMKHRGTARRRPVIVSGLDAPAGSPVVANGREAGTIGQVVDGAAVAILRLDRITDPEAVTVDGKPVRVALPAWATYRFGDVVAEE